MSVYHKLTEFKKQIYFSDIDSRMINEIRNHLTKIGNAKSTIESNFSVIRKYLRLAKRYGIHFPLDLADLKVKNIRGNRVALKPISIKKLFDYFESSFIPDERRLICGYFLFSCFTGLRIGLGFAKGLSIAHSIPLVGISTLDVLAYMQPKVDCVMLALISAGRKSIVSGRYIWHSGRWKTDGAPYITTWQEVVQETKSGSFYICGELGTVDRAEFAENVIIAPSPLNVRRAAYMIEIAIKRLDTGDLDEPNSLSPFYLRTT